MQELAGRTAFLTGAGPNIGRCIAQTLAAEGATVVCNDINPETAEETAEAVRASNGKAITAVGDISEPQAVGDMIARASAEVGTIDILVNNAGVAIPKGILTMEFDEWRKVHSVILDGAFLMSQAIARRLVDAGRKGSIVNVVSTSGHRGRKNAIAYCAAKGGVLNLTRAMAMDLAPHGIRVNSVSPTKTGGSVSDIETAKSRDFSEIPLGRLGAPEDQARAVLFLVSDRADFITGEDIRVDGGSLATWGTRSQPDASKAAS